MPYASLDSIRTGWLNDELGILDSDVAYGDTTTRNNFLRRAFAKMWPTMARLTRQVITTVADVPEYTLTGIKDIVGIQLQGISGYQAGKLPRWSVYTDEAAYPSVIRLTLGQIVQVSSYPSFRVIGYVPYLIPANGVALCDLPDDKLFVVSAGARVEAYRWKLGQFANFQDHANENRANSLSSAELVQLLAQAKAEFEQYKTENQRDISAARSYIG